MTYLCTGFVVCQYLKKHLTPFSFSGFGLYSSPRTISNNPSGIHSSKGTHSLKRKKIVRFQKKRNQNVFQDILSNFNFLHGRNEFSYLKKTLKYVSGDFKQLWFFTRSQCPVAPANCRPPACLVGWGYFWLWIWMLLIASNNIPSATYVLSQIKVGQNGHQSLSVRSCFTRMHSSRMRTVLCSGRRGGGCLPGGRCLPGGGCLLQCMLGYTPPVDRILDTRL